MLILNTGLTQSFNVRLSLTSGAFHATDVRGSNENRDFEATTFIIEPALIGEYYFIKNKAENSYLFTKGKVRDYMDLLNHSIFMYLQE